MDLPSSPSSIITIPPSYHETAQRLGKMIAEAMTCRFALLHYDSSSKSMVEWCWPADSEGQKIPPSDLEDYCAEYNFKYPCCLCADSGRKGGYIETAVYSWWNETTKKTYWIARCASDTCGYQVKIDGFFQLTPSIAFQYPRRDTAQTLQKMYASRSKASNETPHQSLFRFFRRGAKATGRLVIAGS
ncbi:uncharacterized protein F5891DRAFT_985778 [Suillus fuscotomentosus]|uniref:Uncharacterized protein n=1 Tax=Suillus fuscotomentosus TaxID=1912939 RepID=A0AAD4HFG7_9AGAM|nr:uncharacterized protein F5891DRAFT_985778 [Suillus fuscotomentosus]KAG1893549.1 hypothetical protein F5891DRAFT_985778 [Suillus fuscotomentosus]